MFGLLLNSKTAAEAATKIRMLKKTVRSYGFDFADIFPVLLTDNGGENSVKLHHLKTGWMKKRKRNCFSVIPMHLTKSLMSKTTTPYSGELPSPALHLMIGHSKMSI